MAETQTTSGVASGPAAPVPGGAPATATSATAATSATSATSATAATGAPAATSGRDGSATASAGLTRDDVAAIVREAIGPAADLSARAAAAEASLLAKVAKQDFIAANPKVRELPGTYLAGIPETTDATALASAANEAGERFAKDLESFMSRRGVSDADVLKVIAGLGLRPQSNGATSDGGRTPGRDPHGWRASRQARETPESLISEGLSKRR